MPANEKLLNTIFRGEITSVLQFGAFVAIPDTRSQGLVHKSQISNSPVDDATEVLQRGESVWCKVISFTSDGKVGLSMKVVNQGSGKDLDPNGVQIQQDERKRQAYNPRRGSQRIELEAVFNTTCSKCGCKGHLARECFRSNDGKSYSLLSDDEDSNARSSSVRSRLNKPESTASEISEQGTKKKLKRDKKDKKKKKSKKLKEKRKKKKDRKEKKIKKKRRKRDTSSSSSSSSDSSDSSSEESSSSSNSSSSEEDVSKEKESRSPVEIPITDVRKTPSENRRMAYSPPRREHSRHRPRLDDSRGEYRGHYRRGRGDGRYEHQGRYEHNRPQKRYRERSFSPRYHQPKKRY